MANETDDTENKNVSPPSNQTLPNVPSSSDQSYQLPTTSAAALPQNRPVVNLLLSSSGQTRALNQTSLLNLSIAPSINQTLNDLPSTSSGQYHGYSNSPIRISFSECRELLKKCEMVEKLNSGCQIKVTSATSTSTTVPTTLSNSQLDNSLSNVFVRSVTTHDTKAPNVYQHPGNVTSTSSQNTSWPSTSSSVPWHTPLRQLPSNKPVSSQYSQWPSTSSSVPIWHTPVEQHHSNKPATSSQYSQWPSTSSSVSAWHTPLEQLPSDKPMSTQYSLLSSPIPAPTQQGAQLKQESKRKWEPISAAHMSTVLKQVIQLQQEAKRKRETEVVSIQMVKSNAPVNMQMVKATIPPAPVVNPTNPISQESYSRLHHVPPVVHTTTQSHVFPSISPSPPFPPNWNEHLKDTMMSMSPYQLFPVPSNSSEYATLTAMLDPIQITVAEQVVNPSLWTRFTNARKDMLLAKSDDVQLLSKLGLDEEEAMNSVNSSTFTKHSAVAAYPYNDNMALLFHCTKSKANVDSILRTGLDERLGDASGRAGRGIYFADDPNKSVQYDACGGIIFIFAVLLGDCLSVNHLKNKRFLVKEPDKLEVQKRNVNDFNFDSIVIRTSVSTEYVVYNRYQCCPLYKIQYKKPIQYSSTGNAGRVHNINNKYLQFRNKFPPFSWIPRHSSTTAMPSYFANTSWQFSAEMVFIQMSIALQEQNEDQVVPAINESSAILTESEMNEKLLSSLLTMLSSLGFYDVDLNLKTLMKFEYCLETSVNYLLDEAAKSVLKDPSENVNMIASTSSCRPGSSSARPRQSSASNKDAIAGFDWNSTTKHVMHLFEDCQICCNEYESTDIHWKLLECSHKLCVNCYKQLETTRTTMSGVAHTFVKCPFCLRTFGTEIGTCPNGNMRELIVRTSCEGYEGYNTISIRYYVNDFTHKLYRSAYVPDNDEGRKVVKLLRIAWDRRLCFNIGTSSTTGRENVLVWNIHHKTAQRGGVQLHGFPDPTYLERVKLELKAYNID